jgi:hypothetical protein
MTVEQYWLSETVITACGMTGAALTLLCLLPGAAHRAVADAGPASRPAGQDPGQLAVLLAG